MEIDKVDNWDDFPELYNKNLTFKVNDNIRYPFYAEEKGAKYILRFNNFPKEPGFTLFLNNKPVMNFNDWPENWAREIPGEKAVEIDKEDNWDDFPELYNKNLTFNSKEDGEYSYYAEEKDIKYNLRLNNFPEEPKYTLFLNNKPVINFNDLPENWVREDRTDLNEN